MKKTFIIKIAIVIVIGRDIPNEYQMRKHLAVRLLEATFQIFI